MAQALQEVFLDGAVPLTSVTAVRLDHGHVLWMKWCAVEDNALHGPAASATLDMLHSTGTAVHSRRCIWRAASNVHCELLW